MSRPQARTTLAFIDLIDRDRGVARLLLPAQGDRVPTHSFPAALLPEGAGEGSWVEVRISTAHPPPGEDPTALRQRLGQGDDGGDISL